MISKHIISILVNDKFGALSRIIELFSSRGYNLTSICSGPSERPNAQRLTLIIHEDGNNVRKIVKSLNTMIDVVNADLLNPEICHGREMMLMKIAFNAEHLNQIINLIMVNKGRVIEMSVAEISFEMIGNADRLDKLIEIFRQFDIVELARTGEAAIHR